VIKNDLLNIILFLSIITSICV